MASRTPGRTTTLIVSPRGQITLPKPVRARLRLAPGSVLLLREEAGKIVLDPAAVTPVSLYADAEIENLVGTDRASLRERAPLRRRWGLKAGARRRRGRGWPPCLPRRLRSLHRRVQTRRTLGAACHARK